ncbi:unnamed protein product [Gordionus sp. m RMFG-2023]
MEACKELFVSNYRIRSYLSYMDEEKFSPLNPILNYRSNPNYPSVEQSTFMELNKHHNKSKINSNLTAIKSPCADLASKYRLVGKDYCHDTECKESSNSSTTDSGLGNNLDIHSCSSINNDCYSTDINANFYPLPLMEKCENTCITDIALNKYIASDKKFDENKMNAVAINNEIKNAHKYETTITSLSSLRNNRFGALTNNRSIVLSDSIESTKYKNEHYSKMNSSHGSTYKYTGKITLSDIRIPLLWTEKEHFKSVKIKAKISDSDNGSSWCLFALAIFKNQILESSLITGINAAFTDVTFEKDIFTFYDMPPDFVIKLEFYCSSSRFIFKSKILDQFKTRIPTAKNLVSKYSLNGLTNSKSTSNFVSYWPTMRFKADLSTITSPSKNMGNAMATFKKINLGNFLSHNFLPPYPNGKINKGRGNMSSSCSVDFVQPSNRLNLIASDKYGDNYSNKISKQSFPNSTQESIYSAISNLDDINPVKYILIADCELTSDLVNSSFQVGDLHVKINDSGNTRSLPILEHFSFKLDAID